MILSDPVGAGEIAQRAGVVKATVWSWQKRHSDFPAPWRQLEMGPVWDWAEVEAWLQKRIRDSKHGPTFLVALSAIENQRAALEQEKGGL